MFGYISSMFDSQLNGVTSGMSALLSEYPKATSEHPSVRLSEAIASLHRSGIEVDASKDGLMFHFDESEGFSGARSRIKAVQSQLKSGGVAARLFVSDVKLLTRLPETQRWPLHRQFPKGTWELMDDGSVQFTPREFSRYSMEKESAWGPVGRSAVMLWPQIHIRFPEDESESMNKHIDFRWTIGADAGIPIDCDCSEGTQAAVSTEVEKKARDEVTKMATALADSMKLADTTGQYTFQIEHGYISAACSILHSLCHNAHKRLRDKWGTEGWTFASEYQEPVPRILASEWGQ